MKTKRAFLMLPFSAILTRNSDTVHILGGLFLLAGTVYLLSYLFAFLSIVSLAVGLTGSLVLFIKGLLSRSPYQVE